MRTTVRLVVFSFVVTVIAVFIAPPVSASSDKDGKDGKDAKTSMAGAVVVATPSPAPANPVVPAAATVEDSDLVGSWTGTITPSGLNESLDGGYVSIERGALGLVAIAGPNTRVRYVGQRLARTDRGLRFEITLPGDANQTRLLVYDLAFNGEVMIGSVTFVRHGLTQPAAAEFVKQ